MNSVYFDHNSTTMLHPAVKECMLPWLGAMYGNATSRHVFGRHAREVVETARRQIAECLSVQPQQVIFTSGGTEANNFAIHGIALRMQEKQVLVSAIEHPCVSRAALMLRGHGFAVSEIAVDRHGVLNLENAVNQLQVPTGLISVMLANNETGVMQPLADLAQYAKRSGAYVHTDAVQAFGKVAVDFTALGVHAMTISSHKIGGPVGVGALILDKRVDIEPLLHGGGQERGLRSGTENVAAIVGFAKACQLGMEALFTRGQQLSDLRAKLELGLAAMGATIFGQVAERIPNTSFFSMANIEGETLVTALDKVGFAVASGSACSSDSHAPSHVLLAMGVAPDLARGAVRVSLGPDNTEGQVVEFLTALQQEVQRLQGLNVIAA